MALLTINFEFEATVLRRGARKPVRDRFGTDTVVEVPDTLPGDLEPLVELCPEAMSQGLDEFHVHDGRVFRWWGQADRESGRELSLPSFFSAEERRDGVHLAPAPGRPAALDRDDVREVIESGRAVAEALVHRAAGHVLVCGGAVYLAGQEPTIRAYDGVSGEPITLPEWFPHRLSVETKRRGGGLSARFFRLDEGERALEWLSRRQARDGLRNMPWMIGNDRRWVSSIKVLHPDALEHSDADEALRVVEDSFPLVCLRTDDPAAGVEWYAVRDWLRDGASPRDAAHLEMAASAVLDLALADLRRGATFVKPAIARLREVVRPDGSRRAHTPLADPDLLVGMRSPGATSEEGLPHASRPGWGLRIQGRRVLLRRAPVAANANDVVLPPIPTAQAHAVARDLAKAVECAFTPDPAEQIGQNESSEMLGDWALRHTAGAVLRETELLAGLLPMQAGIARLKVSALRAGNAGALRDALLDLSRSLGGLDRRDLVVPGHMRPARAEALGRHLDKMRALMAVWSEHAAELTPEPSELPVFGMGA